MMQLFMGMDGGGTGCRAQGLLSDGRRTAIVTAGPANIATDPAMAQREIATALAQVLAAARLMVPDICPAQIVLGLAGARETAPDGVPAQLRAALPYRNVTLCGDGDIALWGAFGGGDGIVLVLGTGSVLMRQYQGQRQSLGGYGLALGDEGSGAWMGRAALRHSLYARDGLGPHTSLTAALWQRFGTLAALLEFAANARPCDYASLAPVVLEHERAGCPVAGAIMDEGCAWLQRAIQHFLATSSDLPVAALGGLGPVMLARVRAQGSGASMRIIAPQGSALDGALWYARQQAAP